MTVTLRDQSDEQIAALQTLIEKGGLDRDLMVELRQQFMAMTKGEEHERPGKHQQA